MSLDSKIGVDTPFLLAHTMLEHRDHARALAIMDKLLEEKTLFALCPTVVDEFLHVATDPKRFEDPVKMATALNISENWINSRETILLMPTEASWRIQHQWISDHRLGRKRINDTGIASIYHHHGIRRLLTGNPRDFRVLDCFDIMNISEE